MDQVLCDSHETALLHCNHLEPHNHWFYCSRGGGAGVRCRDSRLNIQAISITLVNTTCNTLHTVVISWKLHNGVEYRYQPTSNIIKCNSRQHNVSIELSVDRNHSGTFTTQIGGLLPSATHYTCCVTPVYGSYVADMGCIALGIGDDSDETSESDLFTLTETTYTEEFVSDLLASSTPTELVSGATVPSHFTGDSDNRISIIGGVLGFIFAVLLILLAICGGALLYLLTSKK